jgi:hypothetical protein
MPLESGTLPEFYIQVKSVTNPSIVVLSLPILITIVQAPSTTESPYNISLAYNAPTSGSGNWGSNAESQLYIYEIGTSLEGWQPVSVLQNLELLDTFTFSFTDADGTPDSAFTSTFNIGIDNMTGALTGSLPIDPGAIMFPFYISVASTRAQVTLTSTAIEFQLTIAPSFSTYQPPEDTTEPN